MALSSARATAFDGRDSTPKSRRNRSLAWAKFRRNRLAAGSAVLLLVLALMAVLAPWVATRDPLRIDLRHKFAAPGTPGFVLGADELGRDLFSRLLHAGRVSLAVGLLTALIAVTVGSILGALAGYYSGTLDAVIMRIADTLLSTPTIFVLLALSAFLKPRFSTIILIIGLNSWMSVARLVRGQILSIKQQEFILAARALGAGDRRLIFRQLLPNSLAPVLVAATLNVATAILTESSLSYLGYGIQPPTATWGNMLNNAQAYVRVAPWVAVYPGAMITLTVLSFNFAGDGVRDALDPRLTAS